jgi:hypothetical protein
METMKPTADAALQMAKNDKSGRRKARHLPDMKELQLAVGR